MGRRSRQAGFNIVEAVVVLAAVGVIGTVGWFVYQHDRTKLTDAAPHSNPPSSQQTTPNTTSTKTGATLDIKEWGVHLTLDSTTASLYYYFKPNIPNVAYVSLRNISAVAPNCAAEKFALGAISRLTEAEQQTATANPSAFKQPGTIHIGSYWYTVGVSQAACTDGTAAMNAAVSHAAPNYNPGVLLNTLNTLTADPAATSN